MTENILKSQAFTLKGRLYTMTVLHLLQTDEDCFAQQLKDVITKAPKLFEQAPLVLDFSAVDPEQVDLQSISKCVREHGLIPVAVQGGGAMLETLAQCQGLAVLGGGSSQAKPLIDKPIELESIQSEVAITKLVTSPVRSGQQIVSKGSDIVVVSSVGYGGELLADGNIHVYGKLRGRALAGISGNKDARIFCHSLEAELVSIAGFYRLSDAIERPSGPCQIYLQDDRIKIDPL